MVRGDFVKVSKIMTKKKIVVASCALMLCNIPPASGGTNTEDVEQLKKQIQLLLEQNRELNERLTVMEKNVQSPGKPLAGKDEAGAEISPHNPEDGRDAGGGEEGNPGSSKISEYLNLTGLIEGIFSTSKAFDGNNTSELALDKVELVLNARATEWAAGKIVIDYDGDDDDRLYIDEAHITLGGSESFPLHVTIGKIYAPFGDFSTNMIQDPLTQTLGEVNTKGVIAGFERKGFSAALFSYNGFNESSDPSDEGNDTINGFGGSVAFTYGDDDLGFDAGAAWINDIADSGAITDYLEAQGMYSVASQTGGINAHFNGHVKGGSLLAEYVAALDDFRYDELADGDSGGRPGASNVELSYGMVVMDKQTILALGYQRSWEALALELPEQRCLASLSVVLFDGTTVSFEYYRDRDYSVEDGGTGEDGYGFSTKLAYEF